MVPCGVILIARLNAEKQLANRSGCYARVAHGSLAALVFPSSYDFFNLLKCQMSLFCHTEG